MIIYRRAIASELKDLKSFLFEHGTNPWNYLPLDGVDKEFDIVSKGAASIIVAVDNARLLGFAIFYHPNSLPSQYLQYTESKPTIYIAEAVVHKDYTGQGIGYHLLRSIIDQAADFNASLLLIDRHEENMASAGMMRKAGFELLTIYNDPKRRHYGSCNTAILCLQLNSDDKV
jgi:GNAT superfamily N-acetyltransferase